MILRGGVEVVGVQVGHLALGDLAALVGGQAADLLAVRLARALLDPERLADQHRGGRGLGDEVERAVLVDRDLDRDDRPGVRLRARVERLAELHDVDPVLAQRGADRRRRVGGPGGDLQLDQGENLLGHARRTRIQRCGFAAAALLGALALGSPAQAAFPGPNGRIFFTAHSPGAPEPDVWSIEPDGTGLVDLPTGRAVRAPGDDPSVAPSGLVAFTVGAGPAAEIWVMAGDGSAPRRLTANGVADQMPALSPDGARIAYATDSGAGGLDLWTMRSDGGGARAAARGPGDDVDPAYLASGDYVFSASAVGPSGDFDIAAVTIAGLRTRPRPRSRSAAPPTRPTRRCRPTASGSPTRSPPAACRTSAPPTPSTAPTSSRSRPTRWSTRRCPRSRPTARRSSTRPGPGSWSRPPAAPTPGRSPPRGLARRDPDWAVGAPADRLAPQTTITKRPHRRTRKRTARFAFGSTEAGSSFECRLDRAGFAPCVAPVKYRRLKRGRHRFEVRAIDAAGNADPSPATAVVQGQAASARAARPAQRPLDLLHLVVADLDRGLAAEDRDQDLEPLARPR